jgi:hypothetical protein
LEKTGARLSRDFSHAWSRPGIGDAPEATAAKKPPTPSPLGAEGAVASLPVDPHKLWDFNFFKLAQLATLDRFLHIAMASSLTTVLVTGGAAAAALILSFK